MRHSAQLYSMLMLSVGTMRVAIKLLVVSAIMLSVTKLNVVLSFWHYNNAYNGFIYYNFTFYCNTSSPATQLASFYLLFYCYKVIYFKNHSEVNSIIINAALINVISKFVISKVFICIAIKVTRLGNFPPIGLLLEAHYDFLKGWSSPK
jgi:hypothetical protein